MEEKPIFKLLLSTEADNFIKSLPSRLVRRYGKTFVVYKKENEMLSCSKS